MIDHIGIAVSDIAKSRTFTRPGGARWAMSVQMEATPEHTESGGTAFGFGVPGEKIFWIADQERRGEGTHVAFKADTRAQVDQFHAAGLKAGGRDNGAPGLRSHYGPNYYAAFVHDPDGANIEAVCYAEQ